MNHEDEPYIRPPSTPSLEIEEQSEKEKDLEEDLEIIEDTKIEPTPKPFNNILKIFEELFKNIKNLFLIIIM